MRQKRLTHRSGIKSGLFAIIILVFLAGGVYAVGWSGIFAIKTISCKVDGKKECSPEIRAELDQYVGENLFSTQKSEIETKLIFADRLIKTTEVNFKLPSSLTVEIVSRKPTAAITSAGNITEAVEVDKDGVILRKTENIGDFPRLIWPQIVNWPIENPVPENIVKAAIITSLAGEKFQLEGAARVESQSSMAVMLKSGEKIRLSLISDPVEQLAMLQVVLNQAKIEGKQVGEIDMRFERPVVR